MDSPPQPPRIPDYELILLIGEGGFGQIWMGRDVLGLYRAVKVIRYSDSKSLESYQAEYHGIAHYAPYSRKYDGLIEIHHGTHYNYVIVHRFDKWTCDVRVKWNFRTPIGEKNTHFALHDVIYN